MQKSLCDTLHLKGTGLQYLQQFIPKTPELIKCDDELISLIVHTQHSQFHYPKVTSNI